MKRRDVPPEGIKGQFEFFQEGDGACRGLDQSRPAALVEFPRPTIGMMFIICFPGFTPNQPVSAEVQLPDGSSRRMEVDTYDSNEGVATWFWYTFPGDPIGTYTVRAAQGTRRGTGSFTVVRATTPRLIVFPPSDGPPGTTFRIGLAGFPASSDALLYLYRQAAGPYQYVTSVTVPVDATGEAIYSVMTASDDPRGRYCFLFRGAKAAPDYACGWLDEFAIT